MAADAGKIGEIKLFACPVLSVETSRAHFMIGRMALSAAARTCGAMGVNTANRGPLLRLLCSSQARLEKLRYQRQKGAHSSTAIHHQAAYAALSSVAVIDA